MSCKECELYVYILLSVPYIYYAIKNSIKQIVNEYHGESSFFKLYEIFEGHFCNMKMQKNISNKSLIHSANTFVVIAVFVKTFDQLFRSRSLNNISEDDDDD